MENTKRIESKKSSFETRVRTAVVEKLHLTKVITPVGATIYTRKRVDGKVKMVAESIYSYDASVQNTNSPYSGVVVHASTEQDAMKKLNERLYEMALVHDIDLYDKVNSELEARDIKKKKRGMTEKMSSPVEDKESATSVESATTDAA